MDDVAPEVFQGCETPEISSLFLNARDVAEADRIGMLARKVPMKREFGFHLLFEPATAGKLQQNASKDSHGLTSKGLARLRRKDGSTFLPARPAASAHVS